MVTAKEKVLLGEILKAEFKILVSRAHNAERRTEEHMENCYVCGNAEDWDRDLCEYGDYYLDEEMKAWEYVHNHPEWRD
jgi:hypothetical protein